MVHVKETQDFVLDRNLLVYPSHTNTMLQSEKVELYQPVAKIASILLGKLIAIKMAPIYILVKSSNWPHVFLPIL